MNKTTSALLGLTAFAALSIASAIALAAESPAGRWQTIDDETRQPKSIVEIQEAADGTLSGRVVQVLQSSTGPNPTCDRCSGDNRGKPIEGMTILWNLSPNASGSWEGGTILDPANGRTYRSKAQLLDGNRLGVSGCVAFICREQIWVRE